VPTALAILPDFSSHSLPADRRISSDTRTIFRIRAAIVFKNGRWNRRRKIYGAVRPIAIAFPFKTTVERERGRLFLSPKKLHNTVIPENSVRSKLFDSLNCDPRLKRRDHLRIAKMLIGQNLFILQDDSALARPPSPPAGLLGPRPGKSGATCLQPTLWYDLSHHSSKLSREEFELP